MSFWNRKKFAITKLRQYYLSSIYIAMYFFTGCKNPELTAVKSYESKTPKCNKQSSTQNTNQTIITKFVNLAEETTSNLVGGTAISERQDPRALGTAALKITGTNTAPELCSAAYIAEGLLVTAAHCLIHSDSSARIEISFGPQLLSNSPLLAQSFRMNQNFTGTAGAHDIAWIKFAQSAVPPGYKPASLLTQFDSESGPPQVSLVGYGPTGTRDGNQGVRRAIESTLVALNSEQVYPNEFLLPRFLDSRSNSCSGDSGGPGFIKAAGEWFLFSVTRGRTFESGELQSCESGRTVVTLIHPYIDWIEQSSGINISRKQKLDSQPGPVEPLTTDSPATSPEIKKPSSPVKPAEANSTKQNITINAAQIAQSLKTASAKTQQKSTTNNCQ